MKLTHSYAIYRVWGSLTVIHYKCEAHSHLSYHCEAHSQLRYRCEAHSCIIYVEMDIDDVFRLHLSSLSQLNTGIAKWRSPADRVAGLGVYKHIACMSRYSLYPPRQPLAQLSPKQEVIRQTTYSVYTCTHCMHDSCWRLRSLDHLTPWQEVQKVREVQKLADSACLHGFNLFVQLYLWTWYGAVLYRHLAGLVPSETCFVQSCSSVSPLGTVYCSIPPPLGIMCFCICVPTTPVCMGGRL